MSSSRRPSIRRNTGFTAARISAFTESRCGSDQSTFNWRLNEIMGDVSQKLGVVNVGELRFTQNKYPFFAIAQFRVRSASTAQHGIRHDSIGNDTFLIGLIKGCRLQCCCRGLLKRRFERFKLWLKTIINRIEYSSFNL